MILELNLQFFAQDGPGGEKTEEPTSKKREDVRKKGQVAKSTELNNAITLIVMFIAFRFLGLYIGEGFMNIMKYIFTTFPDYVKPVNGQITIREFTTLLTSVMLRMLLLLLPVFAIGVTVAFTVNLVQVKWKVSFEPMKPKFDKLNPVSGFKRFFSVKKLIDLALSIAKIALIFIVVYNYLKDSYALLSLFYDLPVFDAVGVVCKIVMDLGLRISLIYLFLAFLDYIYQRYKFHKDIMMTKQEVKDEMKNSEGDPQIKGKIRQKMMEVSRRRMMQAVPQADVVITNPTHFAVALKYDTEMADAPIVVAKGQDFLAQKIKDEAREANVEIVENKPLARMLYHNVEVGEVIPPELYQAVAEVLAFVYNARQYGDSGRRMA